MGIFFKIRSPALIEDLSIPEEAHWSAEEFLKAMNDSYSQVNFNIHCIIFII